MCYIPMIILNTVSRVFGSSHVSLWVGYESCYASFGLLPMQVYSFRYRSMTYVVYASLWPLSHQVHTLDLDPRHMLFMQVVTLAYASFRCRTSFTYASSPLC